MAFARVPPCKIHCPLPASRRSGHDAWTAFHSHGGEIRSQAGNDGLQMADRPCAASTASDVELLWGCCQGLTQDIFVI